MDNATVIEWLWSVPALIYLLLALGALATAVRLLIGRYRDTRNGAVLRLAWQFVLVTGCAVSGLAAAVVLGVLSLLLPAGRAEIDTDWERLLGVVMVWAAPVLLFAMETAFGAIVLVILAVHLSLRSYYTVEGERGADVGNE